MNLQPKTRSYFCKLLLNVEPNTIALLADGKVYRMMHKIKKNN